MLVHAFIDTSTIRRKREFVQKLMANPAIMVSVVSTRNKLTDNPVDSWIVKNIPQERVFLSAEPEEVEEDTYAVYRIYAAEVWMRAILSLPKGHAARCALDSTGEWEDIRWEAALNGVIITEYQYDKHTSSRPYLSDSR